VLGSRDQAEDVAQEVVTAVVGSLDADEVLTVALELR
jgi:DNA-directed RNA polymerase specialized sigma24 family protein